MQNPAILQNGACGHAQQLSNANLAGLEYSGHVPAQDCCNFWKLKVVRSVYAWPQAGTERQLQPGAMMIRIPTPTVSRIDAPSESDTR